MGDGIDMPLMFKHINRELEMHIKAWHGDEETKRRIAIDNLDEYYSFVNSCLDYFIWAVCDENELIGELCAEMIDYQTVGISYVINPQKRNQGYCKRMLKEMLELKELACIHFFEAWVDSDNEPSMKCLENVGFIRQQEESDEDLLHYVYIKG